MHFIQKHSRLHNVHRNPLIKAVGTEMYLICIFNIRWQIEDDEDLHLWIEHLPNIIIIRRIMRSFLFESDTYPHYVRLFRQLRSTYKSSGNCSPNTDLNFLFLHRLSPSGWDPQKFLFYQNQNQDQNQRQTGTCLQRQSKCLRTGTGGWDPPALWTFGGSFLELWFRWFSFHVVINNRRQ